MAERRSPLRRLSSLVAIAVLIVLITMVCRMAWLIGSRHGAISSFEDSRFNVTTFPSTSLWDRLWPEVEVFDSDERMFEDDDLAMLRHFERIRTLKVPGATASGNWAKLFRSNRELKVVDISRVPIGDSELAALAGHPALSNVFVEGTHVSDAGIRPIVSCPRLHWLNLSLTNITDRGLADLVAHPQLWRLDVRATRIRGHIGDVGRNSRLEILDATDSEIDNDGVRQILALPSLTALAVSRCPLSDEGFDGDTSSQIQQLYVSETMIGDQAVQRCVKRFKELEEIDASATLVTDVGASALSRLRSLRQINLARTRLSDRGLMALVQCRSLRTIDISQSEVTVEGVIKFGLARPDVEVTWEGNDASSKPK